jgi:hypothetical protein
VVSRRQQRRLLRIGGRAARVRHGGEVSGTTPPWCIILSGGAVLMLDDYEDAYSDGTTFGPLNATPVAENCLRMDSRHWELQWLDQTDVCEAEHMRS